MPFSTAELSRIRHELGMNQLSVGADAYVGVHQFLEVVVQKYIAAEVATTSATQVTGASTPAPAVITLASPTGFATGDRVIVDVDSRREAVTVQSLSGASMTALFALSHGNATAAAYPISLEGPISIVKDILAKIARVKDELATIFGEGALKRVDEIEFYERAGASRFGATGEALDYWRTELASALGSPGLNLWRRRAQAGSRASLY